MAYVRCGNHDCIYHNKRMGCTLSRVRIGQCDNEKCGEFENKTCCKDYIKDQRLYYPADC